MELRSCSVVIPTRNRPELLERCLSSIPTGIAHAIVVDDNSNAQMRVRNEVVCRKFKEITYLSNSERRGAGYSRNLGATNALGEWLCFIDDDDQFHWAYFSRISALLSAKLEILASLPDVVGGKARMCKEVSLHELQGTNCAGGVSGLFIHKSLFRKVGGFDERFPSMQDWDLWLRLIERNALYYSGVAGVIYDSHSEQKITHNLSAKYRGLRRLYFKHFNLWESTARRQHLIRLWALRQLLDSPAPRWFSCFRRVLVWPTAVGYYLKWKKFL